MIRRLHTSAAISKENVCLQITNSNYKGNDNDAKHVVTKRIKDSTYHHHAKKGREKFMCVSIFMKEITDNFIFTITVKVNTKMMSCQGILNILRIAIFGKCGFMSDFCSSLFMKYIRIIGIENDA